VLADPVVKRAESVVCRLQGKSLAELCLAARSFEKDDKVTSDSKGQRATEIYLHKRQGEIDPGRHTG
jgi:hypothetical protein